eukprot:TRINITY_DN3700_c0_g1_i2.p1 TRINITY_DN3700_c0_g1~~TRINITY_DN3700_c0_g1_i2.p1  ORF type:complete len:564 (+),score=168.84 TRINITY_DN3700_c0_g1_i2:633-2324(+)
MWSHRDPAKRRSGVGNLFVKNLGKKIDNQALYDMFSDFGNIVSCKVETDDAGSSKGFGYVHFDSEEGAKTAVEKMNGKEVEGKQIYVGPFTSRKDRNSEGLMEQKFTNVYIKQLNPAVTDEKLKADFEKFGKTSSCTIMRNPKGVSRGFGFVNFVDHEAAVEAVKQMNDSTELAAEGKKLFVGRAMMRLERNAYLHRLFEGQYGQPGSAATRRGGNNLYVKNLDDAVTPDELRKFFAPSGTNGADSITSAVVMMEEKTGTSKGFGFVCFTSPEDAAKAVSAMNGVMLHGKPIYVALAQKKAQRHAQLSEQHAHSMMMMMMRPYMPPPGAFPPLFFPNVQHRMAPYQQGVRQGPPRGYYPNQTHHYQQAQLQGGQPQVGQQPYMQGGQQPYMQGGQQPYMQGGQQPYMQGAGGRAPGARRGPKPEGGAWSVPAAAGSPMVKFSSAARNQPSQVQAQLAQQQLAQQQQAQAQQAAIQPVLVAGGELSGLSEEEQKQMVGEKLYAQVQQVLPPQLCGKITGMLLESLGTKEVLGLLASPPNLEKRIAEARMVYEEHMKKVQGDVPN